MIFFWFLLPKFLLQIFMQKKFKTILIYRSIMYVIVPVSEEKLDHMEKTQKVCNVFINSIKWRWFDL